MERLAGRTALITGAASGIGEATAHRLGAEGAAVAFTDLNDAGGDEVVAELRGGGVRARYRHLDAVPESDWQEACSSA